MRPVRATHICPWCVPNLCADFKFQYASEGVESALNFSILTWQPLQMNPWHDDWAFSLIQTAWAESFIWTNELYMLLITAQAQMVNTKQVHVTAARMSRMEYVDIWTCFSISHLAYHLLYCMLHVHA
ncbi:hypothetical protein XELAEV_18016798mg [Xenopus laevis]|uniref:Uncharacterized protein n=1 Tax=Xenopus laevis TaxID=8355 RepID=A0A974HRT9_XENLA|nr:hypothetical protein XELAEV_18016798mg [Xenopus laevis]